MVYCVFLLCILAVWQLNNRASSMGTMATNETASLETSVTISVALESSLMENVSAKTVSKSGHGISFSKTKIYQKSRHIKKPFKPQGRRKPQFRSLEPPDACLGWSPDINVTADTNSRSLTVDYCQSEELPIPNTYTCVTKTEMALCTVAETPRCGHVFENLTSGNYTIIVKPLCKSCFDVEVYNRDCITPIYTKYIYLEVADEKSSFDQKSSSTTHAGVIIPASCAGGLLVIILVVVYLIAKYRHCTKSFSCGHYNTVPNQTLPNFDGRPAADYQTDIEMSQMQQLHYYE